MRAYLHFLLCYFFLTRTIRSREGVLHFRRWRLFSIPWFRIYLHEIHKEDEDAHLHNHPWNFASLILRGGYVERFKDGMGGVNWVLPWTWNVKQAEEYHKVESLFYPSPSISLVFAWGPYRPWGYLTKVGFMEQSEYRSKKNAGTLPA